VKAIEFKDLVTGLLVVVGIALAIGQYDKLEMFAKKEANESLRGWDTHVFFDKPVLNLKPAPLILKKGHGCEK
jgi:hypothetical protein